ncbi:MAG: hypothetical protein AB1815_02745 [Bacillota bacterium]
MKSEVKNLEKDVLIIKREAPLDISGWKPIAVSADTYQSIKTLAEETNLSISKIACLLIEFAIERVVIEK